MHYSKIIDGLIVFIDRKYVPQMNDLQVAGFFLAAEAVRESPEVLIDYITKNPLVKVFLMPGKDGNINLDRVISALKKVTASKGQIAFNLPGYGKFSFNEQEIDELHRTIMEVAS